MTDWEDIKQRRISIHAPHEGERRAISDAIQPLAPISIHAPHEGERHVGQKYF